MSNFLFVSTPRNFRINQNFFFDKLFYYKISFSEERTLFQALLQQVHLIKQQFDTAPE